MIDYGTVIYKGKKYALVEDAYYNCNYGRGFSDFYTDVASGKMEYYTASAVDEKGNRYQVYWKITNPNAEFEWELCDWDNVSAVKPILTGV